MNYSNLCNAGRCVGLIHPEHTRTAAGVCVCRCIFGGFSKMSLIRWKDFVLQTLRGLYS